MVPFLVLVSMGVYDLGSWVAESGALRGQARAGVRAGAKAVNEDIGQAIRDEGASAIPNTQTVWGNEYAGGSQATCSSASSACGDLQGCSASSTFWTTPGAVGLPDPVACFAITHCTLGGGTSPTCPLGSWQTRPSGTTAGDLLVVVVSYRFTPFTPALSSVTGSTVYARYILYSEVSY